MKRVLVSGLVFVVALLGSAARVQAQLTHRVRAWVPFAFEAGGKVLPAGAYIVTRALDGAVYISSAGGRRSVYAAAHHVRPERNFTAATLAFHRISGRYYFDGVWEPDGEAGMEVWPSRAEREAIRGLTANSPAKREGEVVYVSARLRPGITP